MKYLIPCHIRVVRARALARALALLLFAGSLVFTVIRAEAAPTPSGTEEKRELWTGSMYTSTYRAGVCISPAGKVRGVLLLRLKNGKVDVYHFYGSMDSKGVINARHNSGYAFEGGFDDDTTVSGEVTLTNGFKVSLTGARAHNVELTETCRPVPE